MSQFEMSIDTCANRKKRENAVHSKPHLTFRHHASSI